MRSSLLLQPLGATPAPGGDDATAAKARRGRPPRQSPETTAAADEDAPAAGAADGQAGGPPAPPRRRTPAEAARDRWRASVAARDPGYDAVGLVDSLAPDLNDPEWPSKVADWGQWWHGLPSTPRPPQGTRGAAGGGGGSVRRNQAPPAAVGMGPYWDERDGAEFFATGRLARRRALLQAAARGGGAAEADAAAAAAGVGGAAAALGGPASSAAAALVAAANAAADPDALAFGAEAEAEEQVLDLSPFLPSAAGQDGDGDDDGDGDQNGDEEADALAAEGGYGRREARRLAALSRAFGTAGVQPGAGEAAALARDRRARGTDADAEADGFEDAFARESEAFDALRAAASRRRAPRPTSPSAPAQLPGNPWGRRLRQELPVALASPDVVRQVGPVRATPGGVRDYWQAPPAGGRLAKDPNPASSAADLRARSHKRRRRAALDREWLRLRESRARGAGLNRDPDYFARDARSAAHVKEEEQQGGAPRAWARDEIDALLCGGGDFVAPEVAVPKAAWILNPLLRADMHGDYCVQHVPTTEQFLGSIGRLWDKGASAVTPSATSPAAAAAAAAAAAGGKAAAGKAAAVGRKGGLAGAVSGPTGVYARQLHGGPLANSLVGRRVVVSGGKDAASSAAGGENASEEKFAVVFEAPLNPWRLSRLRQLGAEVDAAAGGPTGGLARAHGRARRRAAEAARRKLEQGGRLTADELAALASVADEEGAKGGPSAAEAADAAPAALLPAEEAAPSPPPPAAAAAKKRKSRSTTSSG